MQPNSKLPLLGRVFVLASVAAALLLLASCTIRENKNDAGEKNVKIDTPVGGLHVSTEVDAKDIGLAVFPGATAKPKVGDNAHRVNMNISTGLFGVKVVAIEFTTDASPDQVAAFYKKELAKYGQVLECAGSGDVTYSRQSGKGEDGKLNCGNGHPGQGLELKAGTNENQHIVSIKSAGKGSEFALVYVNTRGKEDEAL
jgi:hypothetical protein